MSPAGFASGRSLVWDVYTSGNIDDYYVNGTYAVRAVLNLTDDTLATGSGTSSDPFVVSQTKNEKNMQKTPSSFARRKTAKKINFGNYF